jgi:DNA-binding NtrC family response regulator
VEDDDTVRFLATQRLRQLGYRVIEAGSCAQARQLFHVEPQAVDLLLSDVVLSDGAGTALATEFTAVRADMKVVMFSGYTDEKSCHDEILARNWTFLQKPHSKSDIAELLRLLLSPAPGA